MKNIISVAFIFLSLSFWGCKKDIKEPTKLGNGKTILYLKVDDTEYLFEDKKFNIYKNTRGEFNIIKSDFLENSFGLNLECKFKFFFNKENRDKYYYSKINITIDKYNFIMGRDYFIPSLFRINGSFLKNPETEMSLGCDIEHYPSNIPTNYSYTNDTIFNLLYYNFNKKELAFEYNTIFKDRNDTSQNKSMHNLKIKLNFKDEN